MTIDPVNRPGEVPRVGKKAPLPSEKSIDSQDSVRISKDAKKLAEVNKYIKIVKEAPDIRIDKVEQAKKNLESYLKGDRVDDKVLGMITDRILKAIT